MAVVVDLGSGFIKAGLSTGEDPTCVFPSLVGKPRRRFAQQYIGSPCFTGEEAVRARKHLSFFYPIDHGHIEDWSSMDELWNHVFLPQHGFEPEKMPVLVTIPPLASNLHQRRIIETMFDVYNCPETTLAVQGVLSLYAAGRTTGVAVEIGEGVTQILPAIEGNAYREAVRRVDCGGQELTMYLQKLLCNNGLPFTTRDDFEYVRLIKETYCYVALDPATEDMRNDLSITYVLPDNVELRDGSKEITIGPERFYCPEALFNPSLIDKDHPPLYDLVMESFKKSPIDFRTKLLENIVLSGGCSAFKGLQARLQQDLSRVIPPAKQNVLNVHADENRLYAVWHGGRIAAESREAQRDQWVTIQDYQEEGDRVLLRFSAL
eukprot:Gregarina_sp_Pseudo_9__4713@NODE_490_length_2718_cov_20_892870_g462_i0_p2_GENE_NODE_490_length_2718_cov_20_892870_g462_i0NODE_490_length_2718_cov_20_892870_g462_i0_p2_ORF_typecomplete_len377_score53_91Actin/PF00022_19/3_4e91MreB_Mbl/PF06723_13/9e10PilM_2/PF11104_8/79PilM_2/PF11104_8/0_2_NODE_490_length_2718_cov_20_892870_g462_i015502680